MEPIEIIMCPNRIGRLLSMFLFHEYHGRSELSCTVGRSEKVTYFLMDEKIYAFYPFNHLIKIYIYSDFKKWVETKKTVKLL